MPKVTEQYRTEKKEEITAAALRVIARKGFGAASMVDIIEESGLSAGAIYGHFESKQAIARQVAASAVSRRLTAFGERSASGTLPTPAEVIEQFVRDLMLDLPTPAVQMHIWSESQLDPEIKAMSEKIYSDLLDAFTQYLQRWHERQGSPMTNHDIEALAVVMLGLIQGSIVQRVIAPVFDVELYVSGIRLLLPN